MRPYFGAVNDDANNEVVKKYMPKSFKREAVLTSNGERKKVLVWHCYGVSEAVYEGGLLRKRTDK